MYVASSLFFLKKICQKNDGMWKKSLSAADESVATPVFTSYLAAGGCCVSSYTKESQKMVNLALTGVRQTRPDLNISFFLWHKKTGSIFDIFLLILNNCSIKVFNPMKEHLGATLMFYKSNNHVNISLLVSHQFHHSFLFVCVCCKFFSLFCSAAHY